MSFHALDILHTSPYLALRKNNTHISVVLLFPVSSSIDINRFGPIKVIFSAMNDYFNPSTSTYYVHTALISELSTAVDVSSWKIMASSNSRFQSLLLISLMNVFSIGGCMCNSWQLTLPNTEDGQKYRQLYTSRGRSVSSTTGVHAIITPA